MSKKSLADLAPQKTPRTCDYYGKDNLIKSSEITQTENHDLQSSLWGIYEQSQNAREKTCWTPDEVKKQIGLFFQFCSVNTIKPTKVALATWLGISKSEFLEWENGKKGLEKEKKLTAWDKKLLEKEHAQAALQNDLDKHTIGAMFLLKCGYGYVESSKLDITTGDKSFATDVAEVNEAINRLGLDDE